MKKINFIIILLLSITTAAIIFSSSYDKERDSTTAPEEFIAQNELIGEWKLLHVELVFPDTSFTIDSTMFHSIYMVGDGYFSFFYSTPDKKAMTAAGWGTYLLEDSKYIENIQFHSTPYITGTSVIFDSKVEGNIWTHTGYLPVREEDEVLSPHAKGNPTFKIIEVRRKVNSVTF